MGSIKNLIYEYSPRLLQNVLISLFNSKEYGKRYGGKYEYYKKYFASKLLISRKELDEIQLSRLNSFLQHAKTNAPYYANLFKDIEVGNFKHVDDLRKLPIISKEEIRSNVEQAYTIKLKDGLINKTGGTTGKSLEVLRDYEDVQEKFAMVDLFREQFGYKLGKKTAWFSGKTILHDNDAKKGIVSRYDFINKVRYYSTFHINETTARAYINDLNKFKPEFIVGFPSSLYELARFGLDNNLSFVSSLSTIFPTAETLVDEEVSVIEQFFGGKMRNQYSSSEGAPFVVECLHGNLHYELLSGVIEILDDKNQPSATGRAVVTSFATRGTPLVRYDIGDRMTMSDRICTCGRKTPIVESILGRINDFIFSPENGKINLGNLSNSVKYVKGVKRFQVHQNELNSIDVLCVVSNEYTNKDELFFRKELVDRLGTSMRINFKYVDDIPKEKSGKYRLVKNTIKHKI